MLIRSLPLIAGIAPFIAINVAYWIGMHWGPLPDCIPYIDGCTSISSTGRHPPGSFLFRAVEMPVSGLLLVVWFFTVAWLGNLQVPLGKFRSGWIMAWGTVGAIALLIYVTFLGTEGPFYEFMRRSGVYLYFLGTAVAQIFATLHMLKVSALMPGLRRLTSVMLWLCLMPFAIGVLDLILKEVLADPDPMENRIEWIAASLMQAWFVALYVAWRKTGFRTAVSVGSTSEGS